MNGYYSKCYERAKALKLGISLIAPDSYVVQSQSHHDTDADGAHDVDYVDGFWTCDCQGYEYRGMCVHIATADLHRRAQQAQTKSFEFSVLGRVSFRPVALL